VPVVGMVRRFIAVVALAIERDLVGAASPWFVGLRGGTPVGHGFRLHLAHDILLLLRYRLLRYT